MLTVNEHFQDTQRIPPRLFHCSNASGKFRVEEVFDFTQEVSCVVALHNVEQFFVKLLKEKDTHNDVLECVVHLGRSVPAWFFPRRTWTKMT